MYDAARRAILDSSQSSSIYVGADSVKYKKDGRFFAKYSVVIIVHMDSNRGCKLFHKSFDMPDYGNIKLRLMTEVGFAVEAATEIVEAVGDRHFEVHIDVNPDPKHKSHVAVKEALGYVKGSLGFDAKIKPHSFAASSCADHLARGKALH